MLGLAYRNCRKPVPERSGRDSSTNRLFLAAEHTLAVPVAYPALVMLTGHRVPKYWLTEVHWLINLSPLWSAAVLTGFIMPLQPHSSGDARNATKRIKRQQIKQVM